eukprot:COSAG06_NODE_64082_length_260_cov_0.968944_1_plen_84_part_10
MQVTDLGARVDGEISHSLHALEQRQDSDAAAVHARVDGVAQQLASETADLCSLIVKQGTENGMVLTSAISSVQANMEDVRQHSE